MAHKPQGRWTYTQRVDGNVIEHMATTPSSQDADAWLLVACSTDERLTVALIHTAAFRFSLPTAALVRLRAAGVPELSVAGKSIAANQMVIDPRVMRHVMPQLIEADEFSVLIPEQAGATHDYTFPMQPNDRALAPLRSHCLDPAGNA